MSVSQPEENIQHTVSVEREGNDYVYTFHPRPDYELTLSLTEGLRAILLEGLLNNTLGFAEREIDPAQRKEGEKTTDIVLRIDAKTPKYLVDKIFTYLNEQHFATMLLTSENYPDIPKSAVPDTRDKVRERLGGVNEM